MMKKLISVILSLCLIVTLVAGCGSSGDSKVSQQAEKQDKYTIRIATSNSNNPTHPVIATLLAFKEELEKKLGDKVEVKIFYGGQLGTSANDVIGGLQHGSFEMATWALGNFGEYSKAFEPMDIPYAFINQDVVYKFVDGPMGEMMEDELLKDTDIKLLSFIPLGFRHFTNSKHPIIAPSDLQGLKIRTMTNPFQMAGIKQLGAAPSPMAYSEVFTSLQQGVIDGQENPVTNIYDAKFQEVQKYMTLTNHNYTFSSLLINNQYFAQLPEDMQTAILESIVTADQQGRKTLAEEEEKTLEKLAEKMEITTLDIKELKKFQEVAKGCWPELREKIGAEKFDKIISEVERIEKELGI